MYNYNEKVEFMQLLAEKLYNNPLWVEDVLRMAVNSIAIFREKTEQHRDNLANSGINSVCTFILDSKKYKQFEPDSRAAMVVDLIEFQFPQGFDTVISSGEREFLESFCSDYFDKSGLHLSYWETDIKHNTGYMTMLKKQWEKVKEG